MRPRHLPAVIAISLLGASFTGLGQAKKLMTAEAKNHIGEQATVCGKVASGRYAASTRGKPTLWTSTSPIPANSSRC